MFEEIKNLFRKPESKVEKPKEKARQPLDIPFTVGSNYMNKEYADPTATEQLKSFKSWQYAALTKRADAIASMELKLYKQTNTDVVEVVKHDILDLFGTVNNQMTFYGLMKLSSLYRNLTGEAYWFLVLDNRDVPIQIYPYLRPDMMEVIPGSKPTEEFIQGYVYKNPSTQQPVPFDNDEIIQFQYPNPMNAYRGMSPLKAAGMAIETDRTSASWNRRFFENGATPRGVIKIQQRFNESLYKQLAATWSANHQGEANSNKIAILFSGQSGSEIDYKDIGLAQKDMEFLNQRTFARDEILAILGVPISMLNPNQDINRATTEAATTNFLNNTVKPEMREWVEELNEFLLPRFPNTEGMFLDFVDPVPGNRELDLLTYDNALKNGWMDVDEVRNLEGLPPMAKKDEPAQKKFNVHYKKAIDSKLQGIDKHIDEKLNKVIRKIVKKKQVDKPEEEEGDKDFEQEGLRTWKRKVFLTDNIEEKLEVKVKSFFSNQKKRLFTTLKVKNYVRKANQASYEFNLANENAALFSVLLPYVKEAMRSIGNDTLKDLGFSEDFIVTKAIEKYLQENILANTKMINNTTKRQLSEMVKTALDNNMTEGQVAGVVEEEFKKSRDLRAAIIALTVVEIGSMIGRYFGFKQSKVVVAVKWWTELDQRVCPFCAPLHGEVVSIDEPFLEEGSVLKGDLTPEQLIFDSKADPKLKITNDLQHPPLHPRCFVHHTVKIYTDKGVKTINKIEVGDKVLTHNGRYKKVVRLLTDDKRYHGDVVKVRYKGLGFGKTNTRNSVTVTPEHPFLTKRGWVQAKDLLMSDSLFVIAKRCKTCNRQMPFWIKERCSMRCDIENTRRIREQGLKNKGKNNAMYGKTKELHPQWKGGKIWWRGKEWDELKKQIRQRDGDVCQKCGFSESDHEKKYGQPLQVHHVNPYRYSKDNDADNLVTLCCVCHRKLEGTDEKPVLDSGGVEFMSVPVMDVVLEHNFEGEKLYNFAVEDDESYVAEGIVTHNCRCDLVAIRSTTRAHRIEIEKDVKQEYEKKLELEAKKVEEKTKELDEEKGEVDKTKKELEGLITKVKNV